MRHWLRSYWLMLCWNAIRLRVMLPLFAVVQAGLGVGVIVGFGYLIPGADSGTVSYLATGGVTISLITVGLALSPQLVVQNRIEGGVEFDRTLPVPRTAILVADLTGWTLAVLPGILLALLVARVNYDVSFDVSPLVVPAFLLVALTSTALGQALAHALPTALVNLATQVLVFFILLFSPINFPAQRLPGWLRAAHTVLPVEYLARLIRQTLCVPAAGVSLTAFLVSGCWAVLGLAVTCRAMARRG